MLHFYLMNTEFFSAVELQGLRYKTTTSRICRKEGNINRKLPDKQAPNVESIQWVSPFNTLCAYATHYNVM